MEFVFDYLSFLAKTVTIVIAIAFVISIAQSLSNRRQYGGGGHLDVRNVGDEIRHLQRSVQEAQMSPGQMKKLYKADAKQMKARESGKAVPEASEGKVYVLKFRGDMDASAVANLRREVTAVIAAADPADEVVCEIESAGGYVHSYGLAASQLHRIRSAGLKLTAVVDKVAASGGYLMAVVADRILAAPFAIIGSIGVAAEIPNVHRLLKKHDIDFEVMTAGEYKRTLTVFGENTDSARKKFQDDLEDTHTLFQEYVSEHRPSLDVAAVATGETWYGQRAVDQGLVDELMTSDEYYSRRSEATDVYRVKWVVHRNPLERAMGQVQQGMAKIARRLGATD